MIRRVFPLPLRLQWGPQSQSDFSSLQTMGTKKTTTPKADAPAKRAAKPLKTVKVATPATPASTTKAAPAKKAAAPRKRTTKPKAPAYTHEDIALRAYFVSEKRRADGLPGDEHSDWLEAERQLAAEHAAK